MLLVLGLRLPQVGGLEEKGLWEAAFTSRRRLPHISAPCPELLSLSGCGGNMGEEESWQEVILDGSALHQACRVLELTLFGGIRKGVLGNAHHQKSDLWFSCCCSWWSPSWSVVMTALS